MSWQKAASNPDRITDPGQKGYWERQDMKDWAAANPVLAQRAMAASGFSLEPSETSVAPQGDAEPQASSAKPTGSAAKPAQNGSISALSNSLVARPLERLEFEMRPLFFELHSDQPAATGGKTGLIASYHDDDNPVFQALHRKYGDYGANYSRNFRGGRLGGPAAGLSLIEMTTGGDQLLDPEHQRRTATEFWETLQSAPGVRSGKRNIYLLGGHLDVDRGETGTAGEQQYNRAVLGHLNTLIKNSGRTNVRVLESVLANENSDPNNNWNRVRALRRQYGL